ncbi:hypothetical protein BK687P6_00028 [Bacteroides phage BK687P6]|nr:hypothetical protein BK687P6_00028 [Bacteroides phage BK687P6]
MGLKKYEIITVGSDKRVRALRSWQVGDRYVNIGDMGGIVYDEKTLSQDGACWLFRGNFGFPGARIGGDSIVDVGEAAIDANGSANVDILGSSVVVGSKVNFTVATGAVDGLILSEADFEQGGFSYAAGVNWEDLKTSSSNSIRTKSPIFAGGAPMILKCNVAGYNIQAFRLDRDGVSQFATAPTNTGEGVTLAIPACQYFVIRVMKNPAAAITPADAAAARITLTGDYETKLSVIDSRLEINPVTSTGTVSIRSGGLYSIAPGAKYPDSVIRNSKVVINGHATDNRVVRLISEFTGCNVTIDATSGDSQGVGIYSNVNNLTFTGMVTNNWNVAARSIIQVTDCDNFAVSPTIFPGLATAQTANMPFIFQGCNVPNGIFYHHAQIANTYKNIDFAKAQADLGKSYFGGTFTLVSSEVEGMYRSFNNDAKAHGYMVESYESVKKSRPASVQSSYGTTIYKDAYFEGLFDFVGTNVFGNTKKHDTQDVSGCKIVNTGATADNMKGNIRVEGNATLTDVSITGSAYFGGNCVVSGVTVEGGAYVKDNAVIVVPAGSAAIRSLKMTENAYAAPASFTLNGHLWLSGNSRFTPTTAASGNGDLFMEDNAVISGSMSVSGSLTMKDNATVGAGALTVYGDVTICGSYNQTVNKSWTGKRTITDVNEPEYDNNVKTKYDF